jgi:hypothetical protein
LQSLVCVCVCVCVCACVCACVCVCVCACVCVCVELQKSSFYLCKCPDNPYREHTSGMPALQFPVRENKPHVPRTEHSRVIKLSTCYTRRGMHGCCKGGEARECPSTREVKLAHSRIYTHTYAHTITFRIALCFEEIASLKYY